MAAEFSVERGHRSLTIDRVKAIAILGIMWLHYFGQPMEWHIQWISSTQFISYWTPFSAIKLLKFVTGFGYLGVNLFVISSGFGLQSSELRRPTKPSYIQFLRGRYARLLPQAILASAVVWLIKVVFLDSPPDSRLIPNALPFIAGINLFADATFYPPINGELWFLGLIIQLYILFPGLVVMLDRIGPRRFLILLFLISAGFRLCWAVWLRHYVVHASYGWCLGRLFEFGFGMCVAQASHEGNRISHCWTLGLCLFWGYFWWWSFPFADVLLGVGLFSAIWHGSTILPGADLVSYLSTRSYSLFLLQHPVIWACHLLVRNTWTIQGVVGFGLFLLVAIGLAEILDTLVVNPRRYWTAAACVAAAVLLCAADISYKQNSPDQLVAIELILDNGGSVQHERSGHGSVVSVQMEGHAFNDFHAEYLLQFPRVSKISLYGSEITDASISRLTALKHLSELGLQGTKITDASLIHLARIPSLRYVWLSIGEAVSEDEVQSLKKFRPELTVYYDLP